ncbi:unnamed protein product [Protopolystoma xenopodis]|uniref:Uncharacterized protein n=1 Tax=Protopolystoma xenopodis TaxID=117903 RepID=A0A3S5B2C1_9PLAT|nr:unnamed protein product [Protopolystoma xenopodis]
MRLFPRPLDRGRGTAASPPDDAVIITRLGQDASPAHSPPRCCPLSVPNLPLRFPEGLKIDESAAQTNLCFAEAVGWQKYRQTCSHT